jgi:hypothetical protein
MLRHTCIPRNQHAVTIQKVLAQLVLICCTCGSPAHVAPAVGACAALAGCSRHSQIQCLLTAAAADCLLPVSAAGHILDRPGDCAAVAAAGGGALHIAA